MASYVKFHQFVEDVGRGVHQLHAAGHTVKVYLTNATPNVANHAVKADLPEVDMTNELNHGAGGAHIQNDYSQTGGTGTLTGQSVVFEASGGDVGPFRYAILYNSSPTSPTDPLVAYWEYPTGSITLKPGETFTVQFGASIFTLT